MKQKNGIKYCPKCKQTKLLKFFYKANNTLDGYKVYCKDCSHKEYMMRQEHYCNRASDYIKEAKIKAFEIIANGKNITCLKRKEWNCCSIDDIDFLSIDHINGDGANHRRKIKASCSSSTYRWVIKNPEEAKKIMQILCMNAQVKKKKLNKEQTYVRNNK